MRISDWSSDVCSSDLRPTPPGGTGTPSLNPCDCSVHHAAPPAHGHQHLHRRPPSTATGADRQRLAPAVPGWHEASSAPDSPVHVWLPATPGSSPRSEEHTSELP